jgi:NAD(P)-dependent dehydrogenase (short-subunit alcohol dehydrogenase family)
MRRPLEGRVAIVTGAGRGIGLDVARVLMAKGASVVLNDLSEDVVAKAATELGPSAVASAGDVSDDAYLRTLPDVAARAFGHVDIVVNNAGLVIPALARDLSTEDFRRTLEINLTAPFVLAVAAAEWMREQGRPGRIVNVSSIAARRMSVHGGAAYTASKAGVLGLTRHLAFEYAPYEITVNAICPGAVASPGLVQLAALRGEDKRKAQVPIGRLLAPSEVGEAVAFLASDAAAGITGVALDVDGGSLLGWEPVHEYEGWMSTARQTLSSNQKGDRE